jgi:hypothetical protein
MVEMIFFLTHEQQTQEVDRELDPLGFGQL